MNLHHKAPAGTHVIVLMHADGSGLHGIWGPYAGDDEARRTLDELKTWPIIGDWSIVACKPYPAPPAPPAPGASVCRTTVSGPSVYPTTITS